jgi:hypothetical protein
VSRIAQWLRVKLASMPSGCTRPCHWNPHTIRDRDRDNQTWVSFSKMGMSWNVANPRLYGNTKHFLDHHITKTPLNSDPSSSATSWQSTWTKPPLTPSGLYRIDLDCLFILISIYYSLFGGKLLAIRWPGLRYISLQLSLLSTFYGKWLFSA